MLLRSTRGIMLFWPFNIISCTRFGIVWCGFGCVVRSHVGCRLRRGLRFELHDRRFGGQPSGSVLQVSPNCRKTCRAEHVLMRVHRTETTDSGHGGSHHRTDRRILVGRYNQNKSLQNFLRPRFRITRRQVGRVA